MTSEVTLSCTPKWLETATASRIEKTATELGTVGEVVTCLIAHPSSDLLLIGTASGKLHVWDPGQCRAVHSVQAHSKDVTRIMFTPDGGRLLTAGMDGFIHFWDHELHRLQSVSAGTPLFGLAMAPAGRELAAGGKDMVVRVWDCDTGVQLCALSRHPDEVSALGWMSDSQLVTAGSQGNMIIWEVEQRRHVRHLRPHQEHVSNLIVSKTGGWYLTSSWDKSIRMWNPHHRERFVFPAGSQAVTAVTLTQDEKLLCAGYWDGSIRVWDVETGRLFDEINAHAGSLIGCAVLPGSHSLVTVDQEGILKSWNFAEMGTTRFVNQHNGEVYSVQYTPDNVNVLTSGHDGELKVWDRNARSEAGYIDSQSGPLTACAAAPDNRTWAIGTAEGKVKIWDAEQQAFTSILHAHTDAVTGIHFVPYGDYLVTSSWDMKLKLWSLQTEQTICTFHGHNKQVSACDISLDGRRLASASWDGTARVWDMVRHEARTGIVKLVLEGHTARVLCCGFSPDAELVATGGSDATVRIWSARKPAEPRVLHGHESDVTACKFTPDGRILISTDREGYLMAWSGETFQSLGRIKHERAILSLAIAPDGSQGVIGDDTGRVRFLELEYQQGPNWVAPATFLKAPPLWKRGAPPIETYEVACIFCGHAEKLKDKQLGTQWKCPQCNNVLMICPRGLPPSDS